MAAEDVTPKSFRVSDSTAEKFREIAQEIGGNQQTTMAKLIEVYEYQKVKEIAHCKSEEIKTFESYIHCLARMYTTALEEGVDAKNLAKSEYEAQLLAKDQIVAELQNRTRVAEEQKEELKTKAEQSLLVLSQQTENYEHLKAEYQAQKEQKEKLEKEYKELRDKLDEAYQRQQSLNEQTLELKQERISLKEEVEVLKKENKTSTETVELLRASLSKAENKNMELKETIKELREQEEENVTKAQDIAKREATIELEKEIFKKEKEYTEKINALQEKHNQEIKSYQEKYMELLAKYK